jgi:hypothetical protein
VVRRAKFEDGALRISEKNRGSRRLSRDPDRDDESQTVTDYFFEDILEKREWLWRKTMPATRSGM